MLGWLRKLWNEMCSLSEGLKMKQNFFILYQISDQFADFELPLDGINLVEFF